MDPIIDQMLKRYDPQTLSDKKNSIKEVIQEIVLCGLSRAGFFKTGAFYGGTALRVFYGLDRFSEDLDFSLKSPDPDFDFSLYIPFLDKELRSFGLSFDVDEKNKTLESGIKSVFLKGNTKARLLLIYPGDPAIRAIAANELIKIKLKIDIAPPAFASFETKYRLLPIPYEITLYDRPSLFAGKIHDVIGARKNRVKGRDLYDYVFYLSRDTPVNLKHLTALLIQSGHLPEGSDLTIDGLKTLLQNRFENIDYRQAKEDVIPFIKNPEALLLWNADFFNQITENLRAADS